jgi:catalase
MKNAFHQNVGLVFLVCVALTWSPAGVAHENEIGVTVTPPKSERLANLPGYIVTAVTVSYAPAGKSPRHRHAGSVLAFVLTGAIRSENSATGPTKIFRAGESFFEPAGSQHLVSENASQTEPASMLAIFIAQEGAQLTTFTSDPASYRSTNGLAREIFETMLKAHGVQNGYRPVHAKGIVCVGSFTPTTQASLLSKAEHFTKPTTPVKVRFSEGSPDPYVTDNSAGAGPRGMATRFFLSDGNETDVVAMSHNGFVVGNGEEFLVLQKAIVTTDEAKPHPWPIEDFLSAHSVARKFVEDNATIPASFATEAFFANHSFTFEKSDGTKQIARYKLIPSAGVHHLTSDEAKGKPSDFLVQELKERLEVAPIRFSLIAQIPNPGDSTGDPSIVWPEDRRTIELGTITLTSVDADNESNERALAFDPTNLAEGIELADDPMPTLRSQVYALSVEHRSKTHRPSEGR